jgi:ABC-2 type transport system ATP-binding protein
MNEAVLDFDGVTRTFGSVTAVDGLRLRIGRGETVALLGPNGAGKSTAVNLLLGLLTPGAGRVTVLGGDPAQAVAAGRVGAMLQDGGLMPGVSVGGLVRLAHDLYPRPRPVAEMLAQADLTAIAGRRVDRLSGGQAQRVRFALAAIGDPELLVLDEPTTAMDVESRHRFWTGIRECAARGTTVLFATHYLEEADENADRIVVVAAGRVLVDGTPGSVKATAGGGRRVRFTLESGDPTDFLGLPGVTSVQAHGAAVTLRTDDAEATVRALFAVRDRVPDLEVRGADLEDAFLSLTAS